MKVCYQTLQFRIKIRVFGDTHCLEADLTLQHISQIEKWCVWCVCLLDCVCSFGGQGSMRCLVLLLSTFVFEAVFLTEA